MKFGLILKFAVVSFLFALILAQTEQTEASELQNNQINDTEPMDKFFRINNTLVLTNDNFQEALDTFSPLLVLFYSNSRDSKKMRSALLASMDSIQNLDFQLEVGMFNITNEPSQNTVQNISLQKVPDTLLFTSNNQYQRFVGLKSESAIMSWIIRQFKDIIFLSKEISTIDEVEEIYTKYLSTVIYTGNYSTEEFQHFKNLTREYRLTQYRHTNNEDDQMDLPQLVILNSQASRNYSSPYNITPQNEMYHYLEVYATRYFQMLDIDILKSLTSQTESYLLIMLDPENPRYEAIYKEFDSRENREYFFKEKFIIGVVEPTGLGGASIQEAFEVEYEDCPFVGIMDHEKAENKWQPYKYKMTSEVTIENIQQFYLDWKKGKVKPFFRSQKQSETQTKINKQLLGRNLNFIEQIFVLVKKIVGSNYDEYVFDPDHHFVIYYYSLNCDKCKEISPLFKKLAQKYSLAGNIWFGEIDMGKNDHQMINVTEVPELHLYPAGEGKKQKPIHLTIKDNVEEIVEQINSYVEVTYKTQEQFQDELFNGTDPLQKKKKPPKPKKKSKIVESERTRFYEKDQVGQQKQEEVKTEL